MKLFKRVLTAALGVVLSGAVLCGCGDKKTVNPYAHIDKTYLNGIDEPIAGGDVQVNGFDLNTTVDLMQMLGCKTMRFRVPASFLVTPEQYDADMYAYLQSAEKKLTDAGIAPMGQCSVFPAYTGFKPDSANSAPYPTDAHYGAWLQGVSELWEKLASLFPDIRYWEMGNEFNAATFFHPNGYIPSTGSLLEGTGGFDSVTKTQVVVDYMYYAARGIHRGNANAQAVMPGLGPLNGALLTVENFLAAVYDRIKSGDAPYGDVKSTDPDDYFEVLCWHPYANKVDESWLKSNDAIYKVAIDNGDEGKKVFFSEFGFSDAGDADKEELQTEYMEKAYAYCVNDMPYVERLFAFRLYECAYAEVWGGIGEVHFGYFKEPNATRGFTPKAKATALQKLYGGTGDLNKYAAVTA